MRGLGGEVNPQGLEPIIDESLDADAYVDFSIPRTFVTGGASPIAMVDHTSPSWLGQWVLCARVVA
jgi:hypothetical protein